MTDLAALVYIEPARPERKYYLNTDTSQIINDRMSSGKLNKPGKDDFDWSIETDGYKRKITSTLCVVIFPEVSLGFVSRDLSLVSVGFD